MAAQNPDKKRMTFEVYKKRIDHLTKVVNEHGFTIGEDKKPVPTAFWKTFFGLGRRQHQGMYKGEYNTKSKCVPRYIERSVHLAYLLLKHSEAQFFKQVKASIMEFENDKHS